jgi:hypothetical protein
MSYWRHLKEAVLWDRLSFYTYTRYNTYVKVSGKSSPVTGRGGPYCCKMSRLPHILVSRFTDGHEVVNLMSRPPFTPGKIPGTNFSQRQSRTKGHSAVGRIGSIENHNDFFGNRTRDLPSCSIMPQPTTLHRRLK